jgi:hypothetical protein
MALLAHGGKLTADATKRRQAGLTVKGANDLLQALPFPQHPNLLSELDQFFF